MNAIYVFWSSSLSSYLFEAVVTIYWMNLTLLRMWRQYPDRQQKRHVKDGDLQRLRCHLDEKLDGWRDLFSALLEIREQTESQHKQ